MKGKEVFPSVARQFTTPSSADLTGKQIKRLKVESIRKNITRNLKEENDRAQTVAKSEEDRGVNAEICRRSPRINKMKPNDRN